MEDPKKDNMEDKKSISKNISNEELENVSGGSEVTDRERRRRERMDRRPTTEPGEFKRRRAF
jgi:bacteriocin-like protein